MNSQHRSPASRSSSTEPLIDLTAEAYGEGQPSAATLPRRKTKDGEPLPLIGLILDPDVTIDLKDSQNHSIFLGGHMVDVTDGVSDRESHVVVIERSRAGSPLFGKRTLRIMALRQLGVTQIYAATSTDIDSQALKGFVEYEAKTGHPFRVASDIANLTETSCPRLLSGLNRALEVEGFDTSPVSWMSELHGEQLAAKALGLCFASMDALRTVDPKDASVQTEAIRRAVTTALDLVPAAAYCTCGEARSNSSGTTAQ